MRANIADIAPSVIAFRQIGRRFELDVAMVTGSIEGSPAAME
ncbi:MULTISPECIES: hypothetical protein [unclassified Rhizobium]|nr:hypothetical protein [Rhizobium sp. 16-488-2a]